MYNNFQIIKYYKFSIIFYLFSDLISKLVFIFMAPIFGEVLNATIENKNLNLHNILLRLLLLLLFSVIIVPFMSWISDKLYISNGFKYSYHMYKKLLTKSVNIKSLFSDGEIIECFIDNINDQKIMTFSIITESISSFIILLITSIYISIYNLNILILIIVLYTIQIIINYKISKPLKDLKYMKQENKALLTNTELHILKCIESIKTSSKEEQAYNKLEKTMTLSSESNVKFDIKEFILSYTIEYYDKISLIFYIGFILSLYSNNIISIEIIPSLIVLFNLGKSACSKIVNQLNIIKKLISTNKKIENLFEYDEEEGKLCIDKIHTIEFCNVSFAYSDNSYVFKNFSKKFSIDNINILEGQNGSGKTTVFKLLFGFYKNYKGDILVNDTNIKELSLTDFRKKIVWAPQKPILINGTVYENIALFTNKPKDNIVTLLNNLNFSKSIDDIITNNGENLSGGEMQKISLIRTILSDAELYIFDEPYNSLDKESILKTQELINNCNGLKIMVTHI